MIKSNILQKKSKQKYLGKGYKAEDSVGDMFPLLHWYGV